MSKVLHYLPRVLSILFILFVSIFALDVFGTPDSLWREITGFLIHLIPSYVLIAVAILAWKKGFIGGIVYIVIGFLAVFWLRGDLASLVIIIPFFIIGVLFLISSQREKT
jgi:hypothetical protein